MASVIPGKYKLSKSENYDEFLKELGLPVVQRKITSALSPEVEVLHEDDKFTVNTKVALTTTTWSFTPGQEMKQEFGSLGEFDSSVVTSGNKWTQSLSRDDTNVTVVYEFGETNLTTTSTVREVTAIRHYNRI